MQRVRLPKNIVTRYHHHKYFHSSHLCISHMTAVSFCDIRYIIAMTFLCDKCSLVDEANWWLCKKHYITLELACHRVSLYVIWVKAFLLLSHLCAVDTRVNSCQNLLY